MNKYTIFFTFIIVIITIYEFRTSFFEGFSGSGSSSGAMQKCSQMSDCKTCVQTKTGQDGVCYWCDGKCTAGDKSHPGCSSDPMKCGKGPNPVDPVYPVYPVNPVNPVNPVDPVYPTDNCPKCELCPKLQQLKTPTFMTTQ